MIADARKRAEVLAAAAGLGIAGVIGVRCFAGPAVPAWAWFGGLLGAAYVASTTVLGPRLGAAALLGVGERRRVDFARPRRADVPLRPDQKGARRGADAEFRPAGAGSRPDDP